MSNNLAENTWQYTKEQFPKRIKQRSDYSKFELIIDKFVPFVCNNEESFEFGVCPASFQHIFHNKGYKLYGMDSSNSVIELEKHLKEIGYNIGSFSLGDCNKLGCSDKKYDFVFSAGFIEHFINFEDLIRIHLNILKPKGKLFISTPNFAYGMQYMLHKKYDLENLKRHYLPSMNPCLWKKIIEEDKSMVVKEYGFVDYMDIWYESNIKTNMSKFLTEFTKISGNVFKKSKYFSPMCYLYAEKSPEI